MGLELNYIDGQSPLGPDEKEGLKIPTVSTKAELNQFEQLNIEKAIEWSLSLNISADKILDREFICRLHRKMFDEVWEWSGLFRKTQKNIGIEYWKIPTRLESLLSDTKFWITKKVYRGDEICIRFKHRLVSIHCFPNGNGRHSRLIADILRKQHFNKDPFSWGASNLYRNTNSRKEYLKALKKADKNNYRPLIKFATS